MFSTIYKTCFTKKGRIKSKQMKVQNFNCNRVRNMSSLEVERMKDMADIWYKMNFVDDLCSENRATNGRVRSKCLYTGCSNNTELMAWDAGNDWCATGKFAESAKLRGRGNWHRGRKCS